MGAELRRYERKSLPVEFRGKDASGTGVLLFEAADLSLGGSFLKSDLLLEQDEALTVEFRVPGSGAVVQASARVAWVRRFPKPDESPGMGVEFTAMAEADRQRLTDYLRSAQS